MSSYNWKQMALLIGEFHRAELKTFNLYNVFF